MKKTSLFMSMTRGAALVELAIITPLILLLLAGIFSFGYVISYKNQLISVVNAGMLYAFSTSPDPTAIQTQMRAATSIAPLTVSASQFCQCLNTNASCTQACSDGSQPIQYVTVTATTTVTPLPGSQSFSGPFTISDTATIRVN